MFFKDFKNGLQNVSITQTAHIGFKQRIQQPIKKYTRDDRAWKTTAQHRHP